MAEHKVIVFGPTGAVGSSAARTAAHLGAKVALAMRDTSKAIPRLSAEQEKAGGFERVTADLTKPDTVAEAVTKSGAKRAFIYMAHGMPDGMRPTIEALKTSGIELVVFLSSFTISGDPSSVPSDDLIPFWHAQVELRLEEIYGKEKFVALRPGYFASNLSEFKGGLQSGLVKVHAPDTKLDLIVPEDIGKVAGTVLAKGPPADGDMRPYIFGPTLMTRLEGAKILARVMGKDVKFEEASDDEAIEKLMAQRHLPRPLAEYLIKSASKREQTSEFNVVGRPMKQEQLLNVERLSGHKATTFEDFVENNKAVFTA